LPLVVPPAVNYPNPIVSVPSLPGKEPREGRRSIAFDIPWGSMGGTYHAVNINLADGAPGNFSQILGISCDNSASGSDVQFIWPDTGETVSVPAYTTVIAEVFTNQTQFFVYAPNANPVDDTKFQILNYAPLPVSIPRSVFNSGFGSGSIPMTALTTTQLIPTTVNGTLGQLVITLAIANPTSAFSQNFTVADGLGDQLGFAAIALATSETFNGPLISLYDMNVRFQQGIKLVQGGSVASGGSVQVDLTYRSP
jgi:hypothetical protein